MGYGKSRWYPKEPPGWTGLVQFSSGEMGPQESTLREEVVGVEKGKENEEGMI